MLFKSLRYLFILLITCQVCIGFKCDPKPNQNRQFDTLVFVQQWPITYCMSWTKSGNECKSLPQSRIWTIHGIWPSRFNTNVDKQPACCDSGINMNLTRLELIEEQLHRNWPSVQEHKSDKEFWEYEWMKHGTCSMSIDGLNSPDKYFYKALDWSKTYNMTSILTKSKILPDNEKSYNLLDIQAAVRSAVNKNPFISCYTDSDTNEQFLNEIHLCFNRELELMDCEGISRKDNIRSNCLDKPINYRTDSVDFPVRWFFACMTLAVIITLTIALIKSEELRRKWFPTLFRNNRFQNIY